MSERAPRNNIFHEAWVHPELVDYALDNLEQDLARAKRKRLSEDIENIRVERKNSKIRAMVLAVFSGIVIGLGTALIVKKDLWKYIPGFSDTEKDKTPEWPEGYKPSKLQLELVKMLPPFPPKEITDPKLTEAEREEKYEEAIFKVFKDSKIPATEEMTKKLTEEIMKLANVSRILNPKYYTDFGEKGLEIVVNEFYEGDTKYRYKIGRRVKNFLLLSDISKSGMLESLFVHKLKKGIDGTYEEASFTNYIVYFHDSGRTYFIEENKSKLDKLLEEKSSNMKKSGNGWISAPSNNNHFITKLKNTILTLILLSNDTFDLDKYEVVDGKVVEKADIWKKKDGTRDYSKSFEKPAEIDTFVNDWPEETSIKTFRTKPTKNQEGKSCSIGGRDLIFDFLSNDPNLNPLREGDGKSVKIVKTGRECKKAIEKYYQEAVKKENR